jgi:type IV pilus assembly protein PilO
MAFDFSKLKEINDLDFEQVAIWPKEIKTVVAIFCVVVVGAICYYAIISSKLPQLDSSKIKETELRTTFESKYRIAVNVDAYEKQLVRMQSDFSSMLKTLPTSNEPTQVSHLSYLIGNKKIRKNFTPSYLFNLKLPELITSLAYLLRTSLIFQEL